MSRKNTQEEILQNQLLVIIKRCEWRDSKVLALLYAPSHSFTLSRYLPFTLTTSYFIPSVQVSCTWTEECASTPILSSDEPRILVLSAPRYGERRRGDRGKRLSSSSFTFSLDASKSWKHRNVRLMSSQNIINSFLPPSPKLGVMRVRPCLLSFPSSLGIHCSASHSFSTTSTYDSSLLVPYVLIITVMMLELLLIWENPLITRSHLI